MIDISRRTIMRAGLATTASLALRSQSILAQAVRAEAKQPLVPQDPSVQILHPRNRVPVSFFIDDSTCLVNTGHFCMPQFAEAWPNQIIYRRPWKDWPREIPDAFVREFGEWCADNGVKGKYSLVPNPACVGWLDRELPGWSRRELLDSLKLVREVMLPNWDLHPEMITHTRRIDIRTGRPFEEISPNTMENWYPAKPVSADEFGAYIAYALKILRNCDLPVEGITTPGGFGNAAKSELSLGIRQAIEDVCKAEIPHYFKYVFDRGDAPTEPTLEHVENPGRDNPRLIVNIPCGTGDWFGGWDGDRPPEGEKYATEDGQSGRMIELIARGDPAIMLCHWPGVYSNGTKAGFESFKKVIRGIHGSYKDRIHWMKITEIARYWAAKGMTTITRADRNVELKAPYACPAFTLRLSNARADAAAIAQPDGNQRLRPVMRPSDLAPNTCWRDGGDLVICFDLPKGALSLQTT